MFAAAAAAAAAAGLSAVEHSGADHLEDLGRSDLGRRLLYRVRVHLPQPRLQTPHARQLPVLRHHFCQRGHPLLLLQPSRRRQRPDQLIFPHPHRRGRRGRTARRCHLLLPPELVDVVLGELQPLVQLRDLPGQPIGVGLRRAPGILLRGCRLGDPLQQKGAVQLLAEPQSRLRLPKQTVVNRL